MRRTALVLFAILTIIVAGALTRPVRGADPTDDLQDARILVLESRVSALETQIATAPSGSSSPTPTGGHTIVGTIELGPGNWLPASNRTETNQCVGQGGYDDIRVGLAVTVIDNAMAPIAVGRIEVSTVMTSTCLLTFTVSNVPDSPLYTFKIGNRGAPVYSQDELEAAGWMVQLSLG